MGETGKPDKPGMTIVEGLKRLRVLEKRMDGTADEIARYASKLSSDKPAFGSDEEQKKEVASRVQANLDLAQEIVDLKGRVDRTNLVIVITIGGQMRKIADWLLLKRKLCDKIIGTFRALNTQAGDRRRMEMRGSGPDNAAVHVERMFDEAEKNRDLRKWQDIKAEIDGRLEVVNATTQLLD